MSDWRQLYNYATETLEFLEPGFVMDARVAEVFIPAPPTVTQHRHRLLIASLRQKIMNGMAPEDALAEVKRAWFDSEFPGLAEEE